jgi:hypothetical protein
VIDTYKMMQERDRNATAWGRCEAGRGRRSGQRARRDKHKEHTDRRGEERRGKDRRENRTRRRSRRKKEEEGGNKVKKPNRGRWAQGEKGAKRKIEDETTRHDTMPERRK